jgi:hypothetical protein
MIIFVLIASLFVFFLFFSDGIFIGFMAVVHRYDLNEAGLLTPRIAIEHNFF